MATINMVLVILKEIQACAISYMCGSKTMVCCLFDLPLAIKPFAHSYLFYQFYGGFCTLKRQYDDVVQHFICIVRQKGLFDWIFSRNYRGCNLIPFICVLSFHYCYRSDAELWHENTSMETGRTNFCNTSSSVRRLFWWSPNGIYSRKLQKIEKLIFLPGFLYPQLYMNRNKKRSICLSGVGPWMIWSFVFTFP